MALEQVRTVVLVGKSGGVFQVGNIPNRGTFCAGRILRGTVKIGDQVKTENCGDQQLYLKQ